MVPPSAVHFPLNQPRPHPRTDEEFFSAKTAGFLSIHFKANAGKRLAAFRFRYKPNEQTLHCSSLHSHRRHHVRTLAGRLVHPTAQVLHIKVAHLALAFVFASSFVETTAAEIVGRLRIRESRPVPPVPSARVGRGRERPGSSNRSLYRMKLRRSNASYPEGNFDNQLLDNIFWSFAPTPDSDDRFARQRHFGLPPKFPYGFTQTGRDSPSFDRNRPLERPAESYSEKNYRPGGNPPARSL
ncbi:unnamed protein product [Acanthosepion pharaonis]|uniref:Uncharacterized protein n=1 Tax=Acanthosepion pharaonis TaxID=158019 RepID=A0A812CGH5_ACAPH|nr:unnamed protein product [Sepia pharaonis]